MLVYIFIMNNLLTRSHYIWSHVLPVNRDGDQGRVFVLSCQRNDFLILVFSDMFKHVNVAIFDLF